MATHYPTSSNQRDVFPTPYYSSQQLDSYHESPCPPVNMIYQNQTSTDTSFLELLSGSVQPIISSEMLTSSKDQSFDDEHNLQYQELSLSLGMQIPTSMELPALHYDYKNPDSLYAFSSHLPDSGERGSQSKELENSEYLSFDLAGGAQNTIKVGPMDNPQCYISPEQMQSISGTDESSGFVGKLLNSKYIKPAQQLLDELVNLHEALTQSNLNKHHHGYKLGRHGSEENDLKYNGQSVPSSMNATSSDPHELTTSSSGELSPSERLDMQSKITALSSMLDKVDRKYREYYQELQIVESTFEMVSGCGAARPYTALAHQTISRNFRSLRDAINRQIQLKRQSLGEQDEDNRVLPRLRYVDKQLRQQRALQHLGITHHSWRPQRGLPEGSVSVLRAWLFEHFLNPYPKDSEKIMLARQTGLTRSQIANWFINARVRLWKPMVEDMYKEEFGDSEGTCRSSPEYAPNAAKDNSSSEDRVKEFQKSMTFMAGVGGQIRQTKDSNTDLIDNKEVNGCTEKLVFQHGAHGDDDIDCKTLNLQGDGRPNLDDSAACSLGPDKLVQYRVDLVDQYRFSEPHLLPDFVV